MFTLKNARTQTGFSVFFYYVNEYLEVLEVKNISIGRQTCLYDTKINTRFRVLNITKDFVVLINMDTFLKLDIRLSTMQKIRKQIHDNVLEIIETKDNTTVVDFETLSESQKKKYTRNKLIIDAINNEYAPNYTGLLGKSNKPILKEVVKRSNLEKKNVWRIIIKYLQSGCKESSLLRTNTIPNTKNKPTVRKRGRRGNIEECCGKNLTEKDLKIMSDYIKPYLSNQHLTIVKCYDDMIMEKYCKEIFDGKNNSYTYQELPPNQRPSLRQFSYFLKKHTTKEERQAAKTGKREYRNSKRILTGTSLNGVNAPGDIFEIDACELDISVVSATDRTKAVGSPVVYIMIDIYSRLIVGASLSFDNNSIIAMTNCFASLVEDKKALLEAFGLSIAPTQSALTLDDIMPSFIKPKVIRSDHGSDFISKQTQRIANELSIELQYAPPGTGSLKAIVERSFRAFQSHFIDLTIDAGTKEHTGISKHNKNAKLTIDDVRHLMYAFILTHNTTQHESLYDLTPDMVSKKVGRIPAEVWRYGIQYAGNPSYITDAKQFLYTLLIPEKAKLRRMGIVYKNLRYIPDLDNDLTISDKMLFAGNGSLPFDIRIDPRTVSKIYYLDNNSTLHTAKLVDDAIHRELAQMTWPELDAFRKEEKRLLAEKNVESEKNRRVLRRISKDIVTNAKRLSGKEKTDTKHMREAKALEKSRVAQELALPIAPATLPEAKLAEPKPIEEKSAAKPATVAKPASTKNILPDYSAMNDDEKREYLLKLAMEMAEEYEDN